MNQHRYAEQVTLLFLGIAFSIAANRLLTSPIGTLDWVAFGYFLFNNVRYLYGDLRWSEEEQGILENETGFERAVHVHFYVLTRFMVIALAYQIGRIEQFLWVFALGQLIGAVAIGFSLACIYRRDDQGRVANGLRAVQRRWLTYNVLELLIAACSAFVLHSQDDLRRLFPSWQSVDVTYWASGLGFSMLFIVMVSDWIMNRRFLFSRPGTQKTNLR